MRHTSRLLLTGLIAVTLFSQACAPGKSGFSGRPTGLSDDEGGLSDYTIDGIGTFPDMTKADAAAITAVANESQPLAPETSTDFSDEVDEGLKEIAAMEQKGQDTSGLRLAIAGKMMAECAEDVSQYRPFPGEPLLGTWQNQCNGSQESGSKVVTTGNYGGGTSGGPGGLQSISFAGNGWGPNYTSTGTGTCTADSSGKGTCNSDWKTDQGGKASYMASITDQPQAAKGTFQLMSGQSPDCQNGTSNLVSSTNPIPQKYEEAMKKLAACYKKAITMTSPILWGQMSQMSPAQQQQMMMALAIK